MPQDLLWLADAALPSSHNELTHPHLEAEPAAERPPSEVLLDTDPPQDNPMPLDDQPASLPEPESTTEPGIADSFQSVTWKRKTGAVKRQDRPSRSAREGLSCHVLD